MLAQINLSKRRLLRSGGMSSWLRFDSVKLKRKERKERLHLKILYYYCTAKYVLMGVGAGMVPELALNFALRKHKVSDGAYW